MFKLYGFLIGLGIYSAYTASLWLARQKLKHLGGQAQKIIDQMFWWVVIGGIIGARIYHVIDYWGRYYSLYPIKVFYLWEGGLGIWGAILGGLMGMIFYFANTSGESRLLKFSLPPRRSSVAFTDLLDIAFFGLPLAQAIGRWGNYFNGELEGRNGEPLFLYESVLDLILFLILWKGVGAQRAALGKITGVYLIGYGVIRILLEPLREEAMIWKLGGLPTASLFSVLAIVIGVVIITRLIYLKRGEARHLKC